MAAIAVVILILLEAPTPAAHFVTHVFSGFLAFVHTVFNS